jgi:hypothetical protein
MTKSRERGIKESKGIKGEVSICFSDADWTTILEIRERSLIDDDRCFPISTELTRTFPFVLAYPSVSIRIRLWMELMKEDPQHTSSYSAETAACL